MATFGRAILATYQQVPDEKRSEGGEWPGATVDAQWQRRRGTSHRPGHVRERAHDTNARVPPFSALDGTMEPMRRTPFLALAAALVLGACSGGEPAPGPTSPPVRTTATAPQLRIETDGGPVEVRVEVADDPEERASGLMNRTSLANDAGMVFLFDRPTNGGFWMKDTLIPLSIAFWDERGRIVAILDMEPCREDPCPVYEPGATYVGALEVNQGFFDRQGVDLGDLVGLEGAADG